MTIDIFGVSLSFRQSCSILTQLYGPWETLQSRLSYLRDLGIPFTDVERRNRRADLASYAFSHLMEMSVALYARARVQNVKIIARLLVTHRRNLREIYVAALSANSALQLTAKTITDQASTGGHYVRLPGLYTPSWDNIGILNAATKVETKQLEEELNREVGVNQPLLVPLGRIAGNLVDAIRAVGSIQADPVSPPAAPVKRLRSA